MKAHSFEGSGVVRATPNGGKVSVAFGKIIHEDQTVIEPAAIAFQIKDQHDNIVTEFALLPDTFGVLMDAIMELYQSTFSEDTKESD